MQRLSLCIDIDGTVTDPLLHKEAEIRSGVTEVISELYQTHYVHFVTAREEAMEFVSLNWLNKHQIPYDTISLLGSPDKVQRAGELESDIFIEDCYENALQLASAGIEVLLIDCSYNQGPIPQNITRVYHWQQIKEIIARHAEQEAS